MKENSKSFVQQNYRCRSNISIGVKICGSTTRFKRIFALAAMIFTLMQDRITQSFFSYGRQTRQLGNDEGTSAGSITQGSCTACSTFIEVPVQPDLCSSQIGCMPHSQNDCYTSQSKWPWLLGGKTQLGSTTVTASDYSPINNSIMIGGYTSDFYVCTVSQVYLASVSESTGDTLWVHSLNPSLTKILAIRFLQGSQTNAMVLVMHPEGMSLVKASLEGTLLPGIQLAFWLKINYGLITTNLGMDSDSSDRLYIGAQKSGQLSNFWTFQLEPNQPQLNRQLISLEGYQFKGYIKVCRVSKNQNLVFFGAKASQQANIFARDTSTFKQLWYLSRSSTTSESEILHIHSYQDPSLNNQSLAAIMLNTENSTGANSLIFLNTELIGQTSPDSPQFLKLPISHNYEVLAFKGISASQTMAFVQNLQTQQVEMIIVDWNLLQAQVKSYNYGNAIMTSALIIGTQDNIYFTGYANQIYGYKNCNQNQQLFQLYAGNPPGQYNIGFIYAIGDNVLTCVKPQIQESIKQLALEKSFLIKASFYLKLSQSTCAYQRGYSTQTNTNCSPLDFLSTQFCQVLVQTCEQDLKLPQIFSIPIPDQTWTIGNNFSVQFPYWTYQGNFCNQNCSGNSLFYQLQVSSNGNELQTGQHPFYLSGNTIFGVHDDSYPIEQNYTIKLVANLQDLSACASETFNVVRQPVIKCTIDWPYEAFEYAYAPGSAALKLPFPTLIQSCQDNGKKVELFFLFEAQTYPLVNLSASSTFWTFFTDLHVWDGQILFLRMRITPLGNESGFIDVLYQIYINPCLTATCVLNMTLDVVDVGPSSSPQIFQLFSTEGICSHSFQLQKKSGQPYDTNLISSFEQNTGTFIVEVSNFNQFQGTSHDMNLICIIVDSQAPPVIEPFTIQIQKSACQGPDFKVTSLDIEYTTNSGQKSFDLWEMLSQQNSPTCPILLDLQPYNPIFQINNISGQLLINSGDRTLDGQIFILTLTASSQQTGNSSQAPIKIKIKSDCRNNQIMQPPNFTQAAYTASLYQQIQMQFTWPVMSIPSCFDGFAIKLLNAQTNTSTELFTFKNDNQNQWFEAMALTRIPWVTQSPMMFRLQLKDQFGISTTSDDVQVTVLDPCLTTTLNTQSVQNMVFQLGQAGASTQVIQSFTDQVSVQYSAQYGNGSMHDLCGPQTFQLKKVSTNQVCPCSFSTLTGASTITVNTKNQSDIGSHQMEIKVSLQNYTNITATVVFTILIKQCELTSLAFQPPSNTNLQYNINSSGTPLSLLIPQIQKSPADCQAQLQITIVDANTGQLLPFVTIDGNNIVVSTKDPQFKGTHNLLLQVTSPNLASPIEQRPDGSFPNEVLYILTCLPCSLDVVTLVKTQIDFTYILNSGIKPFNVQFSSLYPELCPLTYIFQQNGSTNYNQNVFQVSQEAWSMLSTNQSLSGTVYNIKITAYSGPVSISTPQASNSFKVTIALGQSNGQPCDLVKLGSAVIQDPLQVSYYATFNYGFNGALSQEPNCGPVSFRLLYQNSMTQIDTSLVWIIATNPNQPEIKAIVTPGSQIVQTNPILAVVEAKQGTVSSLSNQFNIQFIDPCKTTNIASQNILPMSAIDGQPLISKNFNTFKDSVSIQYSTQFGNGSGSDLCGPQSYQVFKVVNGNYVSVPYVYLTSGQKKIYLEPTLDPDIGNNQFVLVTTLDNYGIKHEEFFNVNVSACTITGISVGSPVQSVFQYNINAIPSQLDIDLPTVTLQPSSCPFEIQLSIQFQADSSIVPFATVHPNNLGFTIKSSTFQYSGTFNIWAVVIPTGPNTVQPVKVPYVIKVTTCGLHNFNTIYPKSDIDYIIGSEPKFIAPDLTWWKSSYCTLYFTAQVNGQSTFNASLFSFNQLTGIFTISNNDPSTDGQIYEVKLIVQDNAGNSSTSTIKVRFIDTCAGNNIKSLPAFVTPLQHKIFDTDQVIVNNAVAASPCGQIQMTYSLPQAQQALLPYLSTYTNQNNQLVLQVNVKSKTLLNVNSGKFDLTVTFKLVNTLNPTFVYNQQSVEIKINLVDPCFTTEINAQPITTFPAQVQRGSGLIQVNFNVFTDTVSTLWSDKYGDGSNSDICAPQALSIFQVDPVTNLQLDSASYLYLQGNKIVFNPVQSLSYGPQKFVLKVSLSQFGVSRQQIIETEITQCRLDSFMILPMAITKYTYMINTQATLQQIPMPQIVKNPADCDEPLLYQVVNDETGLPLPFVSLVYPFSTIDVQSSNTLHAGAYKLRLSVITQGNGGQAMQSIFISLKMKPCLLESISVDVPISDFTYVVNSGSKQLSGSFASLFREECPLTYTFVRKNTSSFDDQIFTFNSQTGALSINTTKRELGGTIKTMVLTATAEGSTASASMEFTVTFVDDCTLLTINPPSYSGTLSLPFYAISANGFTAASSLDPSCGAISYKVLDATTLQEIPGTQIWIDNTIPASPKIKSLVLPNSTVVVNGINSIVLQAVQGGYTGNSIQSAQIPVQFVDPCLTTEINGQVIPPLSAMANDPVASSSFNIFTDSVSVQYSSQFGDGSGSDLCGPQSYQVFKVVNGNYVSVPYVYLTSGQKKIYLNPTLNPDIGNNQFVLVTTLDKYGIKHNEFFNVNVSPCQIKGISAGNAYISAYNYNVNIQNPQTISALLPSITLSPPECISDIQISVIFQSNGNPVPFAIPKEDKSGFNIYTTSLNFSGIYDVWAVVIPSAPNTVQPLNIPYTITIDLCSSDTMSASSEPLSVVNYLVGSTLQNIQLPPLFKNSIATCPVTYSIVNAVSQALSYNNLTKTLAIFTTDISLNGQTLIVNLTATSQQSGSQTTRQLTINFIDPCIKSVINSWTPFTQTMPLQMTIFTNFNQAFTLATASNLNCGTIQYTLMAASPASQPIIGSILLSSNTISGTLVQRNFVFNIPNGIYSLILKADLVGAQNVVYNSLSKPFTIKAIDPCSQLVYNSQTLIGVPAQVTQGSAPILISFARFTDSVSAQFSSQYGDGSNSDICSPQKYALYEVTQQGDVNVPYLTFEQNNPQVIRFDPNSNVFIGTHQFKLQVTSVTYTSKTRSENFSIQVVNCQLSNIQAEQLGNNQFIYEISQPLDVMTIPLPSVTRVPASCSQSLVWMISDAMNGKGYSFIQVQNGQIVVSSNNPQDSGSYQLLLKVQPDGPNSATPQQQPFTLTISPCKFDAITTTQTISSFNYVINSGLVAKSASFTSLYPLLCPITYQLVEINQAPFTDLVTYEGQTTVKINLTDRTLHGKSLKFKLTAQSQYVTQSILFTVSFVSDCTLATLQTPQLPSLFALTYYAEASLSFISAGGSSNPSCGPLQYQVLNASTNLPVAQTLIWVDTSQPGSPKLKAKVLFGGQAPANIKIKLTQGPDDANITNSIISQNVQIKVSDPCLQTVISSQLITAMAATNNQQTPTTQTFQIFKDSVSMQYGNGSGSDLCGPQTYQVFQIINQVQTPKNFVYVQGSQLQLNLNPLLSDASLGTHQFVLVTNLTNYGITHKEYFTVTIDQCIITGINVGQPSLSVFNYEILPNPKSLEITLPDITMTPSTCPATLFIGVTDQNGVIPSFVTVNTISGPKLIISSSNTALAGNYLLNVLIKPQGSNTVQPVTLQYTLVIGRCYVNNILVTNDLSQVYYNFGQGPLLLSFFSAPFPECATTYSMVVNGQSSYNQALFQLNTSNGQLIVESSNNTLQPKVYNIDLTASGISGQVTESFIVNFVDPCSQVVVTAANPWVAQQPTFQLYVPFSYQMQPATFTGPQQCGPPIYQILDSATLTEVQTTIIKITNQGNGQPQLSGSYMSRDVSKWDVQLQRYVYRYKLKVSIGPSQAYSQILVDFNIQLTEPCILTEVNSQSLGSTFDIIIGGSNLNIAFQTFTDSVSFLYGAGSGFDICSPQTYLIRTLQGSSWIKPNWVDVVGTQVVINNSLISSGGVATYYMRLQVTPLYASKPHYEYFTIKVKLCEIETLVVANPTQSTYYYEIKNPATKVDILLPFISVTPNTCSNGYLGIGLDYKLQFEFIDMQPTFLTKSTDKFTLQTSDTSNRGTWYVLLIISPNAQSSSAQPIVKTYTFILSACKLSNPSFSQTTTQINYSIGSGLFVFNPQFSSLFQADCPFQLSLTQSSMAQGTYDNTIVKEFSSTTGVMTIQSSSNILVGTTIPFQIKASNVQSGDSVSFTISINFIDNCAGLTLTKPVFQDTNEKYYLWKDGKLFFNKATASKSNCGTNTFSYKLLDATTLIEIDPQVYVINVGASVPYLQATLPSRNPWLINQPWKFVLKATFGIYGSVSSDPITVPILDPCFNTIIVPQNVLQITTQANNGQTKIRAFDPFFDTISKLYSTQFGDGSLFDLCGSNQVYSLFALDSNNVKKPTNLVSLPPGQRQIIVRQTTEADSGLHNMILRVQLPDFGVAFDQPFVVLVSDCTITAMAIQQPATTQINYSIMQPGVIQFLPYPTTTISPAFCQQGFIYDIVKVGTTTRPQFVTIGATGFSILTEDLSLPGSTPSVQLEVRITPDGPNSVGTQYIIYTLNFQRCHLDQIQISSVIQNFDYYIKSGPTMKQGSFTQLYSECPYTISLQEQINSGFDLSMFTVSQFTKSFLLDTDDSVLNLQTVSLMFQAQSQTSGSIATHFFKVKFLDQCYMSTIQPAKFFQPSVNIEVYTQQVIYFVMPTSSLSCGQFNLSIINQVTGLVMPSSAFVIDLSQPSNPKIVVNLLPQWLQNSPYQVSIIAKLGIFKTVVSTPITINVIDPCISTSLISQNILNMQTTLNANAPVIQTYQVFQDTVSVANLQYGNGLGYGLCGPQSVSLLQLNPNTQAYEAATIASVNQTSQKIQAGIFTDQSQQGEFTLKLLVTLTNYPSITLSLVFSLKVDGCKVNQMIVTQPATTQFTYNIISGGQTNLIIPYPTVIFTPSQCGAQPLYSLSVNGSSINPTFITIQPQGIRVSTNNPSLSGTTYSLLLTVLPNGSNTVQSQSVTYSLAINACQIDQVSINKSIPDQNYVINSGELIITSNFKSSYNCPLTYSLISDLPKDSSASAILDQVNGSVKFIATELSLDGKQFTFDLRATSAGSQDYIIDSFKIKLMDICGTVVLSPAKFAISQSSQSIWTTEDYYFQLATSSFQGCGTINYRVLEAVSLMPVNTQAFTMFQTATVPYIKFKPTTKQPWLSVSPLKVVIEAKLGSYSTVYSSPLELTIIDPCVSTTITPKFIQQMTVSSNDTNKIQRNLNPFTDSISLQYSQIFGNGSGYDLCGPQTYQLFKSSDNSSVSWLYITTSQGKPVIVLDPSLLPIQSNGYYQFTLRVRLTDYQIVHEEFFNVLISDCVINEFTVTENQNRDFTYDLGSPAIKVPYPAVTFTPADCIYDITYSVKILGTNTVPTFIQLTSADHFLIFETNSSRIGNHIIELKLKPEGPNKVGSQTVTYTIEITGCSLNNIQKKIDLPDYQYVIGSAPLAINGSFDSDYPSCQLTYDLKVATIGVYNPASIQFDASSPLVTIFYSQADMVGTTLTLTLKATSIVSQSTATQVFDVQFKSGCENLSLSSPPTVMQISFMFSLWQAISIPFVAPVTSQPISKCGQPKYNLVEESTGNSFYPSQFTFDLLGQQPKVKAFLTDPKITASFPISVQIQAEYGSNTKLSNPFTIMINNPCKTTVLQTRSLSNMQTTVLRANAETQTIQPFFDSVSVQNAQYGNASGYDLCGNQSYQVFEIISGQPVSVLHTTVSGNVISVQTSDPSTIGSHQMRLIVTMVDYPTVTMQISFKVEIKACNILSLTPINQIPNTNYKVTMPELVILIPLFTQVPACGSPISYLLTANGGGLLPFLTFDTTQSPPRLRVQTDDSVFINNYQMVLTARILDPVTQLPKLSTVLSFTLHVLAEDAYCVMDLVSLSQGPSPTTYLHYLGSPAIQVQGSFAHTLKYCELTYFVTQSGYAQKTYDANLISFNGLLPKFSLQADASLSQYDQKTITITLEAISAVSLSRASFTITVTIKDKCWDATYTPASLPTPTTSFDYRVITVLTFNKSSSNVQDCNSGFSYSFNKNNLQPSTANVDITFAEPDKINISTDQPVAFDLTILTSGPKIATPIQSNPVRLVFENRCSQTTLQGQTAIGPIIASELGPTVTMSYNSPIIALSSIIGLPDACGSISQTLLTNQSTPAQFSWLTFDKDTNRLIVSNTKIGDAGTYNLELLSTLTNYPSVKLSQTVTIIIQKCIMTSFNIPDTFSDVIYNLGQALDEQTLEPFTMQPNCGYPINYTANVVSSSNVLSALPTSMKFLNKSVFQVQTSSTNQLGDYLVQITGTVTSGPQTGTSASFRFSVSILPYDSSLQQKNTPPQFVTELPPISLTIAKTGQFDLGLTLPQVSDQEGDDVTIQIDFGQLTGYIVYNTQTRAIELGSFPAEQVPLGLYLVFIELKDNNPLGSLSSNYQIGINILPPKKDGQNDGGVPIYNASAPIIADISNTGLVSLLFSNSTEYEQMLELYSQTTTRRLQQTYLYNTDVSPFQVSLIPSPETQKERLQYNWKIVKTDAKSGMMDIQMDFPEPEYVSSNIDYDKFAFSIVDPKFYTQPNGKVETAFKTVQGDIIRQIDANTQQAKTIKKTTLAVTIISIFIVVLVFVFFLSMADGDDPYLWSFLDTMQLLTHVQLMNVKLPGNAALFMNFISPIFRFDYIQKQWVNKFLRLKFNPSPLPVFQQVGYTQTHMLTNTVTLWVIFAALLVVWTIYFVYIQLLNRFRKQPETQKKAVSGDYKSVKGNVRHMMFVGIPVRLLLLLYLVLAVTSTHNLIALNKDLSSIVAIVTIVALAFGIVYVTNKYFSSLYHDAKNKKEQFGWLARIIHLERHKSRALVYPILFLTRRFIASFVFVFLYQFYAAQVVIWMIMSLIMMFTISRNKPFRGKWLNNVHFVNECFLFLAGVLMLPLSNILEDLKQRDKVGIAFIVLILTCIAFNIIILLIRSFYMFSELCIANRKKLEFLFTAGKNIVNQQGSELETDSEQKRPQSNEEQKPKSAETTEFSSQHTASIPKDSDYDGEEEAQIRFKRKKPISFVMPIDPQTVKNINQERGKVGINIATSMSDLVIDSDLYRQDSTPKRKHAQTVIEHYHTNEKDNKGVNQNQGQDTSRRYARMKLLAGQDINFKVEIVPIDTQKDHYYVMTKNGAPIVKIMPPSSSLSSEDLNIDGGAFDFNYQGRDVSLSDLVNQNHDTTVIRTSENEVYDLNESKDIKEEPGRKKTIIKRDKSSFSTNGLVHYQTSTFISVQTEEKSPVKYKPPEALKDQEVITDDIALKKDEPTKPQISPRQYQNTIQTFNQMEIVQDKPESKAMQQQTSSNEIDKPPAVVSQHSHSQFEPHDNSSSFFNQLQNTHTKTDHRDENNRIQKEVVKETKVVENGPAGQIIVEKETIIKHIYHEGMHDPNHKCAFCDAAPVEKPKVDENEQEPELLHPDSSQAFSSSWYDMSREGLDLGMPVQQQDVENNLAQEIRFSEFTPYQRDGQQDGDDDELQFDNDPNAQLKSQNTMISKPKPRGNMESFASIGSKREKINVSASGVPKIKRPQRMTILGDVPDEIILPTEQNNISVYDKWLQAQKNKQGTDQIVDETDEDSQLQDEIESQELSVLVSQSEESKDQPASSRSSGMIKAPSDSSRSDNKRNPFQKEFPTQFQRDSDPLFERVKNSLTQSESEMTSDVEERMYKLQRTINQKHDNLPAERQFRIDHNPDGDSERQFDLSDQSIDYVKDLQNINHEVESDDKKR